VKPIRSFEICIDVVDAAPVAAFWSASWVTEPPTNQRVDGYTSSRHRDMPDE
jgi:hypothetical protein